jgi:hypothetical protein
MDLFVVPTIGFRLLYGFVIVRIDRRDLVWINVTTNPTAEWIARPPVIWTAYGRNLTTQCLLSPVVPWGTFAVAHSRPPWASTIERQIESPIPMPLDLVVKKGSNSRSAFSEGIPTPQSVTLRSTCASS